MGHQTPKGSDGQEMVNMTMLAQITNRALSTIRYHVEQGNLKVDKRDGDRKWFEREKAIRLLKSLSDAPLDTDAKNRQWQAKAEREEVALKKERIELLILEGKAIMLEDVQKAGADIGVAIKDFLTNFPSRVTPLIVGKDYDETYKILTEHINETFNDFITERTRILRPLEKRFRLREKSTAEHSQRMGRQES